MRSAGHVSHGVLVTRPGFDDQGGFSVMNDRIEIELPRTVVLSWLEEQKIRRTSLEDELILVNKTIRKLEEALQQYQYDPVLYEYPESA